MKSGYHNIFISLIVFVFIGNPILVDGISDETIYIDVQIRKDNGEIKILDSFQSDTLIDHDIYWEYISLQEQNNHLFVIPHDPDNLIMEYDLSTNTKLGQFNYPMAVSNTPIDIAWDPIVLLNGSLRFMAVIASGGSDASIKYTLSDVDSNNLGSFEISPTMDIVYSTGGIGGFDLNTNTGFITFSSDEFSDNPFDVEIVAYNFELHNSTSFFVDRNYDVENLQIYKNELYGIYGHTSGYKLAKSQNGVWELLLDLGEYNQPIQFVNYAMYNDMIFLMYKNDNSTHHTFTITQRDLNSLEIISTFSYSTLQVYWDQYESEFERPRDSQTNALPLLNLWELGRFNDVKYTDDGILINDYYQLYYYDGSGWDVSNMTRGRDELVFMSLPFNKDTRIELVTEFQNYTSSSNSKFIIEFYVLFFAIILVLKIRRNSINHLAL